MRNIYVTTLYNLPVSGCTGELGVYDLYKKAFEISLKRVYKFNSELFDEYIVLVNNESAQNNGDMDYNIIKKLYSIWSQGEVNVLYSEVDTICHGDLSDVFKFDKMMMFAKGTAPDPEEYNSGVLYFPASMPQNVWDTIMSMHSDWKTYWAYFQKIFDTAYKMHGPVSENRRFNAFWGPVESPLITHHFSSRGIHNLLEVYKEYDSSDPLPSFREL
jgi:hypothetical protein